MHSLAFRSFVSCRPRPSVLFRRPISSVVAPLLLAAPQVHSLTDEKKNVRVLDASWFMPNSPRQARREFISRRIPGAQFLDLDEVASPHELDLKHMMPQERVFADACEKLGIEKETHVVIYDTHGVFSSPRALFMFRTFGHQRSSILDGGLPAWIAGGFPVESGTLSPISATKYATPKLHAEALRSYEQIVANSTSDVSSETDLVLDARSYGRYCGLDSEPRSGLPSGHIPNSLSLPFNLFLRELYSPDSDETTYTVFLPPKEIRRALEESVGLERADMIIRGTIPVTTSCGSGMTAGILWLGLKLLGVERISLYDESWTGYAMRPTSRIERTGYPNR